MSINAQNGIVQHVGRASSSRRALAVRLPLQPRRHLWAFVFYSYRHLQLLACLRLIVYWCCLCMCTAKKEHVFSMRPSKSAAPRAHAGALFITTSTVLRDCLLSQTQTATAYHAQALYTLLHPAKLQRCLITHHPHEVGSPTTRHHTICSQSQPGDAEHPTQDSQLRRHREPNANPPEQRAEAEDTLPVAR